MRLKEYMKRWEDVCFLRRHSAEVGMGFSTKVKMWLAGFVSEAYLLHSLDRNDMGDYVNDLVRLKKACRFNGYYSLMLLDKLYFSRMLAGYEEYLPVIYGLVRGRRFHHLDSVRNESVEGVMDLCEKQGRVVIKPVVGTKGEGVLVLGKDERGWRLNGRSVRSGEVVIRLSGLEDCIVTEYVRQHQYAKAIYSASTNTIRVLTLWGEDEKKPFVARAVHRFGTSVTRSLDNWTLGGLCAKVDIETGRLGKGLSYPSGGKVRLFRKHPETSSAIEGVEVPRWETICERIVEMASVFRFAPYIGWDVVVTAGGFKVIEGNNTPGINLMQVHGPLLRDERVRKFYERQVAKVDTGQERCRLPFKI